MFYLKMFFQSVLSKSYINFLKKNFGIIKRMKEVSIGLHRRMCVFMKKKRARLYEALVIFLKNILLNYDGDLEHNIICRLTFYATNIARNKSLL